MKILRLGALILFAFGVAVTARATTDVGAYYWVLKRANYAQTSTANPVPTSVPRLHVFVQEKVRKGDLAPYMTRGDYQK